MPNQVDRTHVYVKGAGMSMTGVSPSRVRSNEMLNHLRTSVDMYQCKSKFYQLKVDVGILKHHEELF